MASQRLILRVQDEMGRGPWRPGLSAQWSDDSKTILLPPIYEEVEDFLDIVRRANRSGKHVGCAVDGVESLARWFTKVELRRLLDMGFGVYDASSAEVLQETPSQLLVATRFAFRKLPRFTDEARIWSAYGPEESIWSDQ